MSTRTNKDNSNGSAEAGTKCAAQGVAAGSMPSSGTREDAREITRVAAAAPAA